MLDEKKLVDSDTTAGLDFLSPSDEKKLVEMLDEKKLVDSDTTAGLDFLSQGPDYD